jgi:hypothetical protein
MAWPSTVTAGATAILASQFNSIVSALQSWGGAVSAASNPLTDLPSVGLHCANASWQEFQFLVTTGGSQPLDTLALQYNLRTTSGGADSWSSFASVAVSSGALTILPAATFSSTVALNGAVTLGAGLNLNSQTVSGAGTFTGSLTLNTVTFNTPANITFGSNWQTWSPTVTATGSMTVSGVSASDAQFLRVGPFVFFKCYVLFTLGGTASNQVGVSLPVAQVGGQNMIAATVQATFWSTAFAYIASGGSAVNVLPSGGANYTLGSTQMMVEGFYRCA